MTEAIARAAGVPADLVRRAHQLGGSLPEVAQAALADPDRAAEALGAVTLRVGRPTRPMLAASAPDVAAALGKVSPAAVEWKIDGVRIQVHRHADQIRVWTRTLDDITARVPEITSAVQGLDATDVVLDGEAVALFPDGRPRPFQVTASRAATRTAPGAGGGDASLPLTPFFFDLLHLDGTDLIDERGEDRFARLTAIAPAGLVIPRIVTADLAEAEAFFADAVARGHEGVVVKSLGNRYAAGRRGSEWIKVKPRHTLDLVILAAEWGHGRRRGWLSNLHLGARDPDTGGMVMLGKTFKGLTDEMLTWQTSRLLDLADPPVASRERPAGAWSGSGPSWSWRSPSTGSRPARATRAAWRCGSPACCATARTRPPPRRTRSVPYAPCGTARTTRGANREKCLAGRERGLADHPARPADPGRPADQQGHRVLRGRARRAGHHRADPAGPDDAGRAGRKDPHPVPQAVHRPGQERAAHRTARPQPGAVLPRADPAPAGDAADRLHPHGGPGHPAVQPGVPAAPRRVPVRAPPRGDRAVAAGPRPRRRRGGPDRGHRRGRDPGHR